MRMYAFLHALRVAVSNLRTTAQVEFGHLGPAELNFRPSPANWSILECLEHLNRYSRYYNAALAQALTPAAPGATSAEVKYSWLGRNAVSMMHPANPKKQRAIRRLNPLGSHLGPEVLEEFDQHQACLLEVLAQAHLADLNHLGVPVEFFRLLKLRLGEALEFVVVHQQRHVQQAQRVRTTQLAHLMHQPAPGTTSSLRAATQATWPLR